MQKSSIKLWRLEVVMICKNERNQKKEKFQGKDQLTTEMPLYERITDMDMLERCE